MLDSAIKVNKMYYLQTLLEKCKYEIKKTKVQSLVTGDSDPSSSDRSSDNESDNQSNNNPDNESDNESNNVFFLQMILCILSLSV